MEMKEEPSERRRTALPSNAVITIVGIAIGLSGRNGRADMEVAALKTTQHRLQGKSLIIRLTACLEAS
jgi:hypothetical protein